MNMKFHGAVFTAAVLVITGFSHMAHSIEEPKYELIQAIGDIEIRQYEASIQAVTVLPGSSGTSQGFRRLAGFIFGGNKGEQKIAMTAPVQETLGVDAPIMAFTMPAQYRLEQLPTPSDSRVTLQNVPTRTVAVVSFSGWATGGRVARYEQVLRKTLKEHSIGTRGNSTLNQYNPPWTLPFLRRNEVMVEVSSSVLM